MSLLVAARDKIREITSNLNEWAVLMTFKTPAVVAFDYKFDFGFNTQNMFTLSGTHTKHHLGINAETGQKVNAKTASVTVSEKFFIQNGYPIRDANDEVALIGHQVAVKDSTGKICTYVVRESYADETLECIVCILGDIEA